MRIRHCATRARHALAVIDFLRGDSGRLQRSETIDGVIMIAGKIDSELGDATVRKAGGVRVQRGANHVWVNRGIAPARLAFVLIDAVPLGDPATRGASPR